MNIQTVLKIHPLDNVIVALENLMKGSVIEIDDTAIEIQENIKLKHKFSTIDLAVGDLIIQYGITVGAVTKPIRKGAAITVDNIRHISQQYHDSHEKYQWHKPDVTQWKDAQFEGVLRDDGQVGTANYWIVLPLVFCQNRNIDTLRYALQDSLGYGQERDYNDIANSAIQMFSQASDKPNKNTNSYPVSPIFPNVDGVKFITHHGGCGGTRDDAIALCRLLAGYINHPNVAGATVLSLGCQNAQISLLESELNEINLNSKKSVLWFEQQDYGIESNMIKAAITQTVQGIAHANQCHRVPVPLSKLKVGVECGGSDGFSGITANPLIGAVADKLVALGASAILGEFPELCGVEQNIIDRCKTPAISEKFIHLMRSYEKHALANGATFDMNPSPGNIKDGLITDAMKSAGAALKGGSSPINDVLDYTEIVQKPGLNLLCTPGNDVESTTALVSSGANLVLFSTGLGTPTGNPIVPVLKVSSNSQVSLKMHDIIDFDAGVLISGRSNIDNLSDDLISLCLKTASGTYTAKSSRLGQDDFIPWKRGVSL
jgi:altronate hydrolase